MRANMAMAPRAAGRVGHVSHSARAAARLSGGLSGAGNRGARLPHAQQSASWPRAERPYLARLGRFSLGQRIGFSLSSGRAPLWSKGACGRDPRDKNKSSLRLVPNIITVPSSPLTHFYFAESTLNALYKVCMPCQNTCKMGSDQRSDRQTLV